MSSCDAGARAGNIVNGFKCYVGITLPGSTYVTSPRVGVGASEARSGAAQSCAQAPLMVNVYMAFNILYNIFIILILKYGSSNILYMAMTIMVPMGNFAFTLDFLPGVSGVVCVGVCRSSTAGAARAQHRPMSVFDIVGLVVIMSGLVIYRFFGNFWTLYKKRNAPPAPLDDEDESPVVEGSLKYPLLGSVMSSTDALFVVGTERMPAERTEQQIRAAYLVRLGIGAPKARFVSFCFISFFSMWLTSIRCCLRATTDVERRDQPGLCRSRHCARQEVVRRTRESIETTRFVARQRPGRSTPSARSCWAQCARFSLAERPETLSTRS